MQLKALHRISKPYTFRLVSSMLLCFVLIQVAQAQEVSAPAKEKLSLSNFNTKTLDAVNKQYSKMQQTIEKQTAKTLERMKAKEAKLQKKLKGMDSTKAANLFNGSVDQKYADLQNKISGAVDSKEKGEMKDYIPGLDSLQTSLAFLQSDKNTLPSLPTDKAAQIQALSGQVSELKSRMQQAGDVQGFIREREALLKEQLANTGLSKQLTSLNKEVVYYQQRLNDYKALLNDKDKLKEKLLSTVRTLPAFQKFWQRNSMLAQLFPMPVEGADPAAALTGLQTRAGMAQVLAQRFGTQALSGSGGGGMGAFQQQVQGAQSQLTALKDKLFNLKSGEAGNSDMTQPDFIPNDQKTRNFLKRIQYGMNIQSQPGSSFLPATSDIAFTLGYKLNDKAIAGIGVSYKMGWGSGLKDIKLTNEGAGIRSYFELKAKGSFWFSGGIEMNYLQSFSSLSAIYDSYKATISAWQKSGLIGVSKKIQFTSPLSKSKKTKESSIQVLYDLLHNQQYPPTQAIKFRVGWGL